MSNHRAPRDVFSGVGTFLKELSVPTSNSTANSPGKMYLVNNDLAFVDNAGVEHILAFANATHSGDVTGSHSATVVEKIRGISVDPTTPTNKQALVYDSTSSMWRPTSLSTPNFNSEFVIGDWALVNGNYTVAFNHLLTWASPVKPQIEIYDESSSKNMVSGMLETELTPTQVILTSVVPFAGSVHLILPFS